MHRPPWIQAVPVRGLQLFLKALAQVVLLSYYLLWKLPRPDTILVQTPPAIPTLALCSFACWWYGARLVVDWHNFGYSIMALTMGHTHMLVRLPDSTYTVCKLCPSPMFICKPAE